MIKHKENWINFKDVMQKLWTSLFSKMSTWYWKHLPPFSDSHTDSTCAVPRSPWTPWVCWPLLFTLSLTVSTSQTQEGRLLSSQLMWSRTVSSLTLFPVANSHSPGEEVSPIQAKCICDWGLDGDKDAIAMERIATSTAAISEQKQGFLRKQCGSG